MAPASPSPSPRIPHDPVHVAIVMDGNGRWAAQRQLKRSAGHQEGLKVARQIVEAASDRGIPFLSLYVFSTENWKRTREEVGFLMELLVGNLRREYDFYREKGIRILHSGRRDDIPPKVLGEIDSVVADTAGFGGLTVNLAINHGGRDEILRGVKRLLGAGCPPGQADAQALEAVMDNPGVPDVDLLVRTGGEMRISNFLLWRAAYAELVFSEALWPDWTEKDFSTALDTYHRRQRRFGGTP